MKFNFPFFNRSPTLSDLLRSTWNGLPEWLRDGPVPGERAVASRYVSVFVLLVFFLASAAHIFHGTNRYINRGYTDEATTLYLGWRYFNPLGKSNKSFVVGETTRWFVRFLYPGGLFHLSRHAGGIAHHYKHGNYLEEHYTYGKNIHQDPTIQDFVFFMRFSFSLIALGSFCLALWTLFRHVHPAAAAVYGGLILRGSEVLKQLHVFYTETTLFILFNLAVFLCFRRNVPVYRRVAYLGVLSAAALSAKLTGVVIAAALFVYVAFNIQEPDAPRTTPRINVFLLSFLAAMMLININAPSPRYFIDHMMWNVLHYGVGHDGTAIEGGAALFLRIVHDTGYFVIPLFLVSLLWLAKSPRVQLAPIYVLGAGVVFVAWSFSNAAFYMPRNVSSLYVMMSFVIALAVGDLVGKTLANKPRARGFASMGLMLFFVAAAGVLVVKMPSLSGVFYGENVKQMQNCGSIGAVGLADDHLQTLRKNTGSEVVGFPGIRGPFKLEAKPVSDWLMDYSFNGKEPEVVLAELFEELLRHDCLVVYRKGQTKQLTNHFAPKHYELEDRVGNWFFFHRNIQATGS